MDATLRSDGELAALNALGGLAGFDLAGALGLGAGLRLASGACGLLTAAGMAAGPFGMPIDLVAASAGVGIVFALFRIVWLILSQSFSTILR